MGLFGDFINHIAGMLGESLRIKRTASKTKNMDEETKALFNKIVKAAENGNVKAMVEVGNWYYKGKRIGYDPERVEYWWTKAAKAGDVDSQYNLGLLFHGNISPLSLDEEKAGYWFYKAAQNGDAESRKMLNKWYEYNNKKGKWTRVLEPNTGNSANNNTNRNNTYNSNSQSNGSTYKSYEQDVREMKIKQFSFVDCSGAYRKWGDTFIDHKGNYCSWGSGFYDYDDNYIHWGNTYKDSSGAYRHWGDDFVDAAGNYVKLP